MTELNDVVVVGGGLLGCALAWMLARDGVRVVLLERDQLNQHASGQNAGSLHYQLEYRMIEKGLDAARQAAEAMPLHLDAAAQWRMLAAELGESIGLVAGGGLMLAENSEQAALLEAKAEIERSWGLDTVLLSRDEVRRVAPYLSDSIEAAAFCSAEGRADTRRAGPALARDAAKHGARIHTRCRVRSIRRTGRRWTVGAERLDPDGTPSAEVHDAEAVILAAGVWTTELGQLLGADLPTIPMALTMTATLKTDVFIHHLVQHAGARLSLKQSAEGNVLIGGGWPARLARDADGAADFGVRPQLIAESVAGNAKAAVRAVPRLAGIPALRTWVGTTTITPDQLPLVGPVHGRPGVFVATGGSAFTLGPSFARVLSELVQGKPPSIDLAPYDPGRYPVRAGG